MGRLERVQVITSKALRGSMASVEFYELSCILVTQEPARMKRGINTEKKEFWFQVYLYREHNKGEKREKL